PRHTAPHRRPDAAARGASSARAGPPPSCTPMEHSFNIMESACSAHHIFRPPKNVGLHPRVYALRSHVPVPVPVPVPDLALEELEIGTDPSPSRGARVRVG